MGGVGFINLAQDRDMWRGGGLLLTRQLIFTLHKIWEI
jgi:hypothetical protein